MIAARLMFYQSRRARLTFQFKVDQPDKPPRSKLPAQWDPWGYTEFVRMPYPRLFARQKPAGRISSVAKLFLAPKTPVVECILIDYSAGGACLQLHKYVELPNRLEVLFGTTKKRCRVVWKRGLRFGVAF